MPIAIASGALGAEIRRVLDRADLTQHFTAIVAAEDTPASKPAPDPYLRAVSTAGRSVRPDGAARLRGGRGLALGTRIGPRGRTAHRGVAQTYRADEPAAADLVIPSMLAFDLAALHDAFRRAFTLPWSASPP